MDTAVDTKTEAPQTIHFKYKKKEGLLKLAIVNWLLGIVTLGIYRFWAKTNVRKHIWSSVYLNGEPLEYTGTGGELFKGALVVFGLFILPFIILQVVLPIVFGPESVWPVIVNLIFFAFFLVFAGYALYAARRYQLSRTQWRGIRGALVGSAWTYTFTYLGAFFAAMFTMGWSNPAMNLALQEQMIGNMRFGDGAFKFRGPAGPLYPTYALCWLLSAALLVLIPLLIPFLTGTSWTQIFSEFGKLNDPGATPPMEILFALIAIYIAMILTFSVFIPMIWAIYTAKQLNVFSAYTRFDGAQFKMNATAGSVIWLVIVNILIAIFTLGIGAPFIQQRLVKFIVDRISLDGTVDVNRIMQSKEALSTRGEGLAEAFDLGAI